MACAQYEGWGGGGGTAIGTRQRCSNKLAAAQTQSPWKGLEKMWNTCQMQQWSAAHYTNAMPCHAVPCHTMLHDAAPLLLHFCGKQHVHPLTRHSIQRHRRKHSTLNGHSIHIHIHIIKSCSNIFGAQPWQQLLVPHVAALRIVGIKGSQHTAANSKLSQTHQRIYN